MLWSLYSLLIYVSTEISEFPHLCLTTCSVPQLFLSLSKPMNCSPPGYSVHGISQARTLEWVAISFSRDSFFLYISYYLENFLGIYSYNILFVQYIFSSVQSLSRVRLFATPWIAARQASLSITNSWSSLRLTSIESVMPSSHLILCCPFFYRLQSIRVFSNESVLHIRWPKYWSFSFTISPSSEHSGLISFRMNWLDLFAVQGSSPIPQFKSTNSLALSFLYGPTLISVHNYWKNHSFD